ncbi:MAG: aminoglycoside phosphotransferase family protein [Lachnospiraceae bacterium]|nr:aminoglycoside phosphotransferase family protein [Lachnospiraceae bacterium]MDY5741951.1 aminoglycoside phosphotransferase family protein [Lachnospiraceae bacterium]
MKLEKKNLIVARSYKEVYKTDEGLVKVFNAEHPKANVFNEALITARVEATGLAVPKILEVKQIDSRWALVLEYKEGKTLEQLMTEHPEKREEYMDLFVELQLGMHEKRSPLLNKLKDKMARKINTLSELLDATTRYELLTRLESMPKHDKLCHGDFNPSNIIIGEDGTATIIDWSHASQGNASADAAMTYILFYLQDQALAELYLKTFCRKSDTAMQYVQQWLPIAAAYRLTKSTEEKETLMRWIDFFDFQ